MLAMTISPVKNKKYSDLAIKFQKKSKAREKEAFSLFEKESKIWEEKAYFLVIEKKKLIFLFRDNSRTRFRYFFFHIL